MAPQPVNCFLFKVRFTLPLLYQDPKGTAKSVSFGFLCSLKGSDPREIHTRSVMANICSNAARSEMKAPRAGSAACGRQQSSGGSFTQDAFARPPSAARRHGCPSPAHCVSLRFWRISPKLHHKQNRTRSCLRFLLANSGGKSCPVLGTDVCVR